MLEAVRIVAVLLAPITPRLSERIFEQLGLDYETVSWHASAWGALKSGSELPKPTPVFQRLEGAFVLSSVEAVVV